MTRAFFAAVLLVFCSIAAFAGEFLTNDTGQTVYGLRVTFSEAVTVTSYGDTLMAVDPEYESTVFVFTGGELAAWDAHWLNWEPASANLLGFEWYTTPMTTEIPEGGLTREDLENLGRPATYEEIMSVIAEYPSDDEPLYEPADDEAIWLTDLEGHADIYDNDSIKINYADWFDQSQVSKIEVYRNGIKMEFLPDKLDVVTNDQMKTFDGNPLEYAPASNHTDHAIWGYEYHFLINAGVEDYTATVSVKAPFHYSGEVAVNLGPHEPDIRSWWSIPWMTERFKEYKAMGYEVISFQVYYFMHSAHDTELFALSELTPSVSSWSTTLEEDHIRDVLRAIEAAGLDAELRLEIWVSAAAEGTEADSHRGALRPSDLDEWFENYGDICVYLARIMEEEGGDYSRPSLSYH